MRWAGARARAVCAAIALLSAVGCESTGSVTAPAEETPAPAVPLDTLPVEGLDVAQLRRLSQTLGESSQYGTVHSLLVMRNGVLVLEDYYRGHAAGQLHTLQSVTKSVTSALVGIFLDEGHMTGVDEPVVDFFPQWRDQLVQNGLRASMRIEDVLTMRTGTDYHESGTDSPHAQLNALTTGWDWFWLNRPMVNAPGTFWRYDSGGVVTLSSVIESRAGVHADRYADRVLFGPMDITLRRWTTNAEDHPHTGGGLFLTPRDMLKFGQLYLQRGRWEGRQLVPEAWVDASLARHETFATPRGSSGKLEGYGYLWWVLPPAPDGDGLQDVYAAAGYGGQFIFLIPEYEMVVGVTGWSVLPSPRGPVDFLYSDVLTAVLD